MQHTVDLHTTSIEKGLKKAYYTYTVNKHHSYVLKPINKNRIEHPAEQFYKQCVAFSDDMLRR